jgi:hypothetical protein
MNRITDSNQRATVLSFKGLLFNLAYGLFGLLYAVVLKGMRHQAIENNPLLKANELDDIIFVKSLSLFPGYFFIMLIGLWVLAYWLLKNNDEYKHAG